MRRRCFRSVDSSSDGYPKFTLQRHFSAMTKFAHEESRFCGHKRRGKVAFDVPVNPCVRTACSRSVAVGFIAIDEETHDQIVHRGPFGKAARATHETLDPRPQIDVLACDLLRMGFANRVLRRIKMTLVRAPSIGREAGDVKGCQELL